MSATSRYLQHGNSVCGDLEEDTPLTREEEKELIKAGLLYLAQTGFIKVKNGEVVIPEKLEADGATYWICGYFTTNETKELWQELQKAYEDSGDNLFNMACLRSDDDRLLGAAA